eukprot:2505081-Amphidinium_carterae.1
MAVAARQAAQDAKEQGSTTSSQKQNREPPGNRGTHSASASASANQKSERVKGETPQRSERTQRSGQVSRYGSSAASGYTHQQKVGIPPPPSRCRPRASGSNDTDSSDDEEDWGHWRAQGTPKTSEKAAGSKGAECSDARRPYPFGPMQPAAASVEQEPVPQPKKRPKLVLSAATDTRTALPLEPPPSPSPERASLAQTWERFGRAKAAAHMRAYPSTTISPPWRDEGQSLLCADSSDDDAVHAHAPLAQAPLQQAALPKLPLPPTPPPAPSTAAIRLPGRPPASPVKAVQRGPIANQLPWRNPPSLPLPPPPPPPPP